MNKKKYIALTLILSLLSINRVSASCTQEELDAFKQVEDQFTVSYQANKDTKSFDVIFNYSSMGKYTYNTSAELKNATINDSMITYKNIKHGEYTIKIMGNTKNCNDILKTITVKVPRYNEYYGDPLCKGIEEFYLCQESYDREIDRETFESRINTYKKNKEQETQEVPEDQEENENKIITYIKENIVQLIIIIVFAILVIITIIVTISSSRKSRRLE